MARGALIFSILILCFTTHCRERRMHSLASSEENPPVIVQLPVTELAISFAEIRTFAGLELKAILHKLRNDYHVKLLVLNYMDADPEISIPNLQQFNLPEDALAVAYYTEMQKSAKPEYEASFLEAGLIREDIPGLGKNRLLLNADVILLHLNVEKNLLLHEVIHLLIGRSEARTNAAKRLGVNSIRTYYAENIRTHLASQKAALKKLAAADLEFKAKKMDKATFTKSINEVLNNTITLLATIKLASDNSAGEEMDIARLMFEQSKFLYSPGVMSKDVYEDVLCLNYYASNLKLWVQEFNRQLELLEPMHALYKIAKQANLGDSAVLDKFKIFVDEINGPSTKRTQDAIHWFAPYVDRINARAEK